MKKYLTLFLLFLISGCAVTGKVGDINFSPLQDNSSINKSLSKLEVVSNKDAALNESFGAFNWGKYSTSDEVTIKKGIRNTLNLNSTEASENYDVHINVHRYAQTVTNASYASFVVIDWCISQAGQVKFEEVFYAGHSDELHLLKGKSLGWAKEVTHKAIITRIVNKSIEFSSSNILSNAYPESFIYTNAEDAINALPKELSSVGTAGLSSGYFYYVGSVKGETNFGKKAAFKKVDWASHLATE